MAHTHSKLWNYRRFNEYMFSLDYWFEVITLDRTGMIVTRCVISALQTVYGHFPNSGQRGPKDKSVCWDYLLLTKISNEEKYIGYLNCDTVTLCSVVRLFFTTPIVDYNWYSLLEISSLWNFVSCWRIWGMEPVVYQVHVQSVVMFVPK